MEFDFSPIEGTATAAPSHAVVRVGPTTDDAPGPDPGARTVAPGALKAEPNFAGTGA